jgi:hypothetical protein
MGVKGYDRERKRKRRRKFENWQINKGEGRRTKIWKIGEKKGKGNIESKLTATK